MFSSQPVLESFDGIKINPTSYAKLEDYKISEDTLVYKQDPKLLKLSKDPKLTRKEYEFKCSKIFLASLNKEEVVVKRYTPSSFCHFYPEALAMSELKSPHIAEFRGVFLDDKGPALIIKRYHLSSGFGSTKNYIQALQWFIQISRAVAHVHQKGWLHRDIISRNIFLDDENNAILADFGEACLQSSAITKSAGRNHRYLAPELFSLGEVKATTHSDVYNLGTVFKEILTGDIVFKGLTDDQIVINRYTKKKLHDDIPSSLMPVFKKIIGACWNDDPLKRPSAQEIAEQLTEALLEAHSKLKSRKPTLYVEKPLVPFSLLNKAEESKEKVSTPLPQSR